MDFAKLLKTVQQEAKELTAEMTFEAYLAKVRRDPRLARLSHQLIYDTIVAAGVTTDSKGRRYELFRGELFGIEGAISQVVEYFAAAASRLDSRKRILLLIGPPGCGKSTLVNAIKQGLEDYTRTADGAVYAIKGCPVYEDPLHLIPRHKRNELDGLHVEGDLCPYCRWLVRNAYRGDISRVPVQRFTFSAAEGVGIGTYVATDPGSEDLARLVGTVDLSQLRASTDRTAARQAYRLDGELNAANRGLADLIEILKMDERFLSVLLSLSQEQMIKLSGRGVMYADEAIVAHSNLAEYEAMVADPKAAALLDRLVVVRMGYALAVSDEVRIYEKMLGNTSVDAARLSPLALPAAATFAVQTRMKAAGSWTLERKLHHHDGRFIPDVKPEDIEALRAASSDDGSFGFSPRYVINQISRALSRSDDCLSGAAILDILAEGLSQRAGFGDEERAAASDLFRTARAEYEDMVRRAICRALVPGREGSAAAQARTILGELKAWSIGARDRELTQVRKLEEALRAPPYMRQSYRTDLLAKLQTADREKAPLHRVDPQLEEGIERMLLPSWGRAAKTLLAEDKEELDRLRKTLVKEGGFSRACADEAIEHATALAGGGGEARRRRWLSS